MTRKEVFSRVDQLAQNDPTVQPTMKAAELAFLEKATGGDWAAWNGDDDPTGPPPYWEASLEYLVAVVLAYVICSGRLARHPAELDQYIDACVWGLTARVVQHKLLFHSQGEYWTSGTATRRFEQAARNRLAPHLAELRARAWKSTPLPTSGCDGDERVAYGASVDPDRGVPSCTTVGEPHAPTPVERRRELVAGYKSRFGQTVAQICKSARVNRSDFYKWIKGKLPDTSGKSARIEKALRTGPALRPAA